MIKISPEIRPVVYVYTEEDFPEWKYEGGEWWNLMGMSWECLDPPKHLKESFDKAEEVYAMLRRLVDDISADFG